MGTFLVEKGKFEQFNHLLKLEIVFLSFLALKTLEECFKFGIIFIVLFIEPVSDVLEVFEEGSSALSLIVIQLI